ncbi:MAG: sensor histidine kinase [Candidatus Electronema sp. V4]|uniref:sensor histidine kinase n=1 Tax=Candidatus Electronema sp. V4 TaxID=3454756 RepID=UPI0040555E7E
MRLIRSIKGRLLLWIFFSMTALFAGLGYALHFKLHYAVNDSLDKMLHANLQFVKGMIHTHDGKNIECESDEFIQGDYVIPDSGHYYKVFVGDSLLSISSSLLDPDFNLTPGEPLSHDSKMQEWLYQLTGPNGEPLRSIRHEFTYMDQPVRIVVAEEISESLRMVHQLTSYFLLITPVMITLIAMISLIIAELSLRPVQHFSDALERISHKNLEARIPADRQAKELRRLAEKFNSLLERLQQAFEAEKNLLGDAAHELKTPLAVIKAECDIALQRERAAADHAASLRNVREVANGMLGQVNSLLTLTRLDSGLLDASSFARISFTDCVEDATVLAEPLARKKNIVLSASLNEELAVLGDKDSLTEAVLNLVENAVKYNHPGGFVAVSLTRRKNMAVFTVSDTGIGISEEDRDRIFDRFYRAAAARSSQDGSGLGLSIVQAVVRTHGGEIAVEGQPGGGSRFTLTLPLAEDEAA